MHVTAGEWSGPQYQTRDGREGGAEGFQEQGLWVPWGHNLGKEVAVFIPERRETQPDLKEAREACPGMIFLLGKAHLLFGCLKGAGPWTGGSEGGRGSAGQSEPLGQQKLLAPLSLCVSHQPILRFFFAFNHFPLLPPLRTSFFSLLPKHLPLLLLIHLQALSESV